MKRPVLSDEHTMFREAFRRFVAAEIVPFHEEWEETTGIVPREVWAKAGAQGFLGVDVPEEYGGGGVDDYWYSVIRTEELMAVGATGVGFNIHTDMAVPYITKYGTEEQKEKWLPGLADGSLIGSIAMTEPNVGSNVAGIETTAVRDGDFYRVNGQKTFISNGINCDVAITAVKTDPAAGHKGVSLLVMEAAMEGFEKGRKLEKIGLRAQDTAELYFKDVMVPAENLIGQEGMGFIYLMKRLAQERLTIAVIAMAACQTMLKMTIDYCQQRKAFGRPIGSFQNSRFKLAEMKTEIEIGQVFVDQCVLAHNKEELTADEAAMAKWWTTELQLKVATQCVQLHGGYGFMKEYPIARAYMDARGQTIYGGTTEIMKELIGKGMGF
ncbi:MAG TPA: acyl-CoA dehydrogenase family protein [Anaerolineae bacterium]|nr:acyl-CoA dehydrogenase family protein [Anaerolineae bacterium]